MAIKNDNTLIAEGERANEDGLFVFDCPYDEDTHARDMWTLGWHRQQTIRMEWEAMNHEAAVMYGED